MLTVILLILIAVLLFACWRLKAPRTVREAITAVIQGGGGPGPRQ
jgi:hypothetical protein